MHVHSKKTIRIECEITLIIESIDSYINHSHIVIWYQAEYWPNLKSWKVDE